MSKFVLGRSGEWCIPAPLGEPQKKKTSQVQRAFTARNVPSGIDSGGWRWPAQAISASWAEGPRGRLARSLRGLFKTG